MNFNDYSYYSQDYPQLYYPSIDHSSPHPATYAYSTFSPCPFHTPYGYNTPTTMPSFNFSPIPYPDYQVPSNLYSPPLQQQSTTLSTMIDRTPLRRHQCFKKSELAILHQAYRQDPHPSLETIEKLATQLKVSIDKIRQWFKNRRHSDKQKKRINAVRTTPTSSSR